MQLLLGLFLFSVLLTTGSSLQCEVCASAEGDCSGPKKSCPDKNAVCLTLKTEISAGVQLQNTIKSCSTQDECKKYQDLKGKTATAKLDVQPGAVIKDVVCSKASPTFALFFPAFFGLLLMKLLF